jgi:hypothetical protein
VRGRWLVLAFTIFGGGVMTTAIAVTGVSDEVFEQFKADLIGLKDHIKTKMLSMASVLAQMSRKQIIDVKKFAKTCDISSNLIDNLCLCGNDEMTIELALHPMKIGNRLYRSLPAPKRAELNDMERPCEVLTNRGLVVKSIRELNALEAREVIQPGVGIIPASQQVPIFARVAPVQARIDQAGQSAFLYDGHNVTSDKNVLLFGRDAGDVPGARTICVKLTPKEWKRLRT